MNLLLRGRYPAIPTPSLLVETAASRDHVQSPVNEYLESLYCAVLVLVVLRPEGELPLTGVVPSLVGVATGEATHEDRARKGEEGAISIL